MEQPRTDTNHYNAGLSDKRGDGDASENRSDAVRSQEVGSGNRASGDSHEVTALALESSIESRVQWIGSREGGRPSARDD